MTYGKPPEVVIGHFPLDWDEYMHWLYLPVDMPTGVPGFRLPPNLEFLRWMLIRIERYEREFHRNKFDYIYVTARRGFATPGNPLNRPGWHADGFGTQDVNYIWCDAYPTRFACGEFVNISSDHVKSAEQFEDQVAAGSIDGTISVFSGAANTVYRLDPSVIHATPEIPAPGGDRSFLKVSLSNDRYNLRGNSHNHLFDYDWKMWDRAEVRNDPAYAGGDAGPQEVTA